MVTWAAAKKLLREGKRIRRPCWEKDSYWELGPDERIMFDGHKAHVHLNQLEAKDWEVIKANLPEIVIVQCSICGMADVFVNRIKKMDYKTKHCKCLK